MDGPLSFTTAPANSSIDRNRNLLHIDERKCWDEMLIAMLSATSSNSGTFLFTFQQTRTNATVTTHVTVTTRAKQ